jgi:hypothetical protein
LRLGRGCGRIAALDMPRATRTASVEAAPPSRRLGTESDKIHRARRHTRCFILAPAAPQ